MKLPRVGLHIALVSLFALGAASSASAATILTFAQNGLTATISGVENGDGTTTISATDASIGVNGFFGPGAPFNAFFNLDATSTTPAVNTPPLEQHYSGTFTITSLAGGGGTNYLSGSFTDLVTGTVGNSTLSLQASTPGNAVSFTSDFGTLVPNLGISLSFISVSPSVAIVNNGGNTLRAFSASVSGVFEAAEFVTVPEPASLLLFGSALFGLAGYRRRMGRK